MKTTVLLFTIDRETKRTYRYHEIDMRTGESLEFPDYAVGTLYIQKHTTGSPPPVRLKVTIEEEE